jgi:hypothetical protein
MSTATSDESRFTDSSTSSCLAKIGELWSRSSRDDRCREICTALHRVLDNEPGKARMCEVYRTTAVHPNVVAADVS